MIFKNLIRNIALKEKRSLFFKKINNKIAFSHDEMVVAMGIIINPIWLKYDTLIIIFIITENKEI